MTDNLPYLTSVKGRPHLHIRDGKKRISTGETSRGKATAVLMKYIAERPGRNEHEATIETVSDLMSVWAAERQEKNEKTWNRKFKYLEKTVNRYAGDVTLQEIDKEWSKDYAYSRRQDGVAGPTIRQELSSLTSAWNIAIGAKLISITMPKLDLPPASEAKDVALTRDQARALIAACEHAHIKLFVRLCLDTAGRPGAILALPWHRVDLELGEVDLRETREERAARGDARIKPAAHVPINEGIVEALTEARKRSVTGNVIEFGGKSIASVRKAFGTAVERAGLGGLDITPHVLRHTAATWMAQADVPLFEIAGRLGHKNTTMVERVYAHHRPSYQSKSKDAVRL
ncbi:site-specific integrase [Loktanella sp. M215]|uniref:site-specific integrase n=1 Tax=Loktanella sp. M215 TaxID=2675431 RepID=UPI001F00BD7A|nr:site-specific integrase [Loktanella sp. M215]MCF7699882.1 tyrosine-type recombinase/integrase [Loktanella sp. M215]